LNKFLFTKTLRLSYLELFQLLAFHPISWIASILAEEHYVKVKAKKASRNAFVKMMLKGLAFYPQNKNNF
jgi:hypothetical protein